MEKEHKKQKIEKLQKKLQNRQLSLYQILQEEIAVDWFKMLHPPFITMLNSKTFGEMISYVVKVGPPDNRIRSYKIPMITAEILSIPMPKVFQLFFMEDQDNKGDILLARLLDYFDGNPNYVLSGYIVKILMNLLAGNAPRVLEYLFKNGKIMKIIKFLESVSIADFLLRIIIVQDTLLNNKIKERIQLYHIIIDAYCQNRQSQEVLDNANYFLTESILRLWSQKHKQLGRFSSEIFRLIEAVIDKNNLYHQENLMIVIMKHLTACADQAPFLIIALFKKLNRELSLAAQNSQKMRTQFKQTIPRFGMKNIKILQALTSMFVNVPEIMLKQLKSNNLFDHLFDFVSRYQWNSILLVEIQKIMKLALCPLITTTPPKPIQSNKTLPNSQINDNKEEQANKKKQTIHSEGLYTIIFTQAGLHSKIKQWIKKQNQKGVKCRGYSGFLMVLCKHIQSIVNIEGNTMGQLISKHHQQLIKLIQSYIKQKQQPERAIECFQIVQNVAKPNYHINAIIDIYAKFFEQTETINKKYQIERPSSCHKESDAELIQQMEIENQYVYKLMASQSQDNNKKSESTTTQATE